jgi:hypothetical protein
MLIVHTGSGRQSCGGIGCILLGILGVIAAFFIVKWTLVALFFASPLLLALALWIRPQAVRAALMRLLDVYRSQPVLGVVYTLLSILAFPLIALSLFMQAVVQQRLAKAEQQSRGGTDGEEYVSFEEIDNTSLPEKDTGR